MMSFSKSIKKLLGITIIAVGFVPDFPALAANWIPLSSNELFEYHVDIDRESNNKNIWTAPLKATTSGIDLGYGRLSINCKERTLKLQLDRASSGWNDWGAKDLKFTRQICARTFPETNNYFGQYKPQEQPIINSSEYNNLIVEKK